MNCRTDAEGDDANHWHPPNITFLASASSPPSGNGNTVEAGTPEYGQAEETYPFHELKSYVDYASGEPLAFRKSKSGFDVDFILGDHMAIELKASENVGPNDLKSTRKRSCSLRSA